MGILCNNETGIIFSFGNVAKKACTIARAPLCAQAPKVKGCVGALMFPFCIGVKTVQLILGINESSVVSVRTHISVLQFSSQYTKLPTRSSVALKIHVRRRRKEKTHQSLKREKNSSLKFVLKVQQRSGESKLYFLSLRLIIIVVVEVISKYTLSLKSDFGGFSLSH